MESKQAGKVCDDHPMLLIHIEKNLRHKQPMPKLPSYAAIATILSFFGWKDDVFQILQILSKTSRAYFAEHRPILGGFLYPQPTPKELGFFGQKDWQRERCSWFSWPSRDKLVEMYPFSKEIRVVKISYSVDQFKAICSIQVHLSNG